MRRTPNDSPAQESLQLVRIDYQSAEHLRDIVVAEIRDLLKNNGRVIRGQLTNDAKEEIRSLVGWRNLKADFRDAVIIITKGDDNDDPGEQWNGNN